MNMNKPTVTVTPDDGGHDNTISVAGVKQTAYEPNDKYGHYDDSDFLYHAIERIAELEAERDRLQNLADECYGTIGLLNLESGELREKNVSLEASLNSLEQTYEALSKDCRDYWDEAEALAAHVDKTKDMLGRLREYIPQHEWTSIWLWMEDSPQTSLAQRDARMKAEALDEIGKDLLIQYGSSMVRDLVRGRAHYYRQQAEESKQ